jgi:hypothetical protein
LRRLLLGLAAALALGGLTAPAASALDYCVQHSEPLVCDESPATLQGALDDAGATADDDVIHIGAVTIAEGTGGFDYLDYDDSDIAGNDVTLIGQGANETTIQRADTMEITTFETGTTDPGPDAHVTLQDLGIFVVGNTVPDINTFNGLRVREGGATLTRVRVTAQDSVFNHDFNSGARLVFASGDLTMSDSTIDGADNQNAECLTSSADFTPVITGTEFTDCHFGVRATASSAPEIDRSTFTGGKVGAQVQDGASIAINRSSFVDGGGGVNAVVVLDDGHFRLDNSLVRSDFGAIRMHADNPGEEASGTVNQSTLVGSDVAVAVSTSAEEASVGGGNGDSAHIEIYDTTITGYQQVSLAAFGGTMTSAYSFYDFSTKVGAHTSVEGDIDSVGDTVDPGFAAPPSDYSLASGSILRDVDPNLAARPGEVFTTDLALNPRIDNGARDVGAFESTFVPEVTPPDQPALTGQRAKALKKCKKVKKKKARKKCQRNAQKLPL